MSLFRPRREARALSYQDVFGSGGDWQSFRDGPALTHAAVYACARLISSAIATMPIEVYRELPDGTAEPVRTPRLFRQPSRQESPSAWKYRAATSLVLRGNAYGLPTGLSTGGFPAQCHWLDQSLVTVNDSQYPDVDAVYGYRGRELKSDEIVHVTAFVEPGSVKGLSPIGVFKKAINAGLAPQEYGLTWFATGGQPSGLLQTDLTITSDQADELKQRWTNSRAEGGIAVLGNGAKYQAIQVAPDEAQFLEAQRFSATQIARIFGVPPEMIGADAGNSMTYSNREQRAIDFVSFTLAPYVTALEEHFTRLLPAPLFVRLNPDRLLTSDLESRLRANAIGIASHQVTPTEARATESRRPLTPEQLTELQAVPLKISPAGKPVNAAAPGAGSEADPKDTAA